MTIPARANGRHRSSIHLKMLITAQLDRSGERREFDGARRRARNIEEEFVGLGVKVHVVLRCTAVWTVIREVAALLVLDDDLSVVGPSAKLPREGAPRAARIEAISLSLSIAPTCSGRHRPSQGMPPAKTMPTTWSRTPPTSIGGPTGRLGTWLTGAL
jgi:hypothetical protein